MELDLRLKAEEINLVLSEPDVNLWKLRELALSEGGLVNDTLRKRAWPKLVGLYDYYVDSNPTASAVAQTTSSLPPSGRDLPPAKRPPTYPVGTPASSPEDGDRALLSKSSSKAEKTPMLALEQSDMLTESLTDCKLQLTSAEESKVLVDSSRKVDAIIHRSRLPKSRDAEQIDRDVARCTWHLLTGTQRSRRMQMKNKHRKKVAVLLRKKQRRLGNLINLTLLRTYEETGDDKLHYYQGFHDVASVFLSALGGGGSSPDSLAEAADSVVGIASSMGLDLASCVLAQVSISHFRDPMRSNFKELQTAIRLLLLPMICYFDRPVHDYLEMCDMEPFFALSWIITWFSHDIRDTELTKRLFDAFLVSHPLLPLYMAVAMVCHPCNREEVLSAECDFAQVHTILSNLPKNSSMIGWTYKPGEGYVSGEDEEEDGLASMDGSMFSVDIEGRDDEESETQSLLSSPSVGSRHVKAPFQEIIDGALAFMNRLPPRRLMWLARKYYGKDEEFETMLQVTPSINLLQPHPRWGLVATAPADWVLKQRARRREGRKTTRRDRRNRRSSSRSQSVTRADGSNNAAIVDGNEEEQIKEFLAENCKNPAVIACGYGTGDEDAIRRRKQRRVIVASIAVAFFAVAVAVFVTSIEPSTTENAAQQRRLGSDSKRGSQKNFNAVSSPRESRRSRHGGTGRSRHGDETDRALMIGSPTKLPITLSAGEARSSGVASEYALPASRPAISVGIPKTISIPRAVETSPSRSLLSGFEQLPSPENRAIQVGDLPKGDLGDVVMQVPRLLGHLVAANIPRAMRLLRHFLKSLRHKLHSLRDT